VYIRYSSTRKGLTPYRYKDYVKDILEELFFLLEVEKIPIKDLSNALGVCIEDISKFITFKDRSGFYIVSLINDKMNETYGLYSVRHFEYHKAI